MDVFEGDIGIFKGIIEFEVQLWKVWYVGLEKGDINIGLVHVEGKFDNLGLIGVLTLDNKLFILI